MQATGGNVTEVTIDGKLYKIHAFTSDGTFSVTESGEVEYLVVAGGGGGGGSAGGSAAGGGGGAGGLLTGSTTVNSENYSISVGGGGNGAGGNSDSSGGNGGNSSALGVTTTGGGGGGARDRPSGTAHYAQNGGSGGGAGSHRDGGGGSGISGQGNDGGSASPQADGDNPGAGGGGAGQSGESVASTGNGGDGGNGLDISPIFTTNFGENGYFASGGGGGDGGSGGNGSGGLGGGGDANQDGQSNTGGGGGGVINSNTGPAGNGGSGIVLIRYEVPTEFEAEADLQSEINIVCIPSDLDPNYIEADYIEFDYFEGEQIAFEGEADLVSQSTLEVVTTVFVPASADLQSTATQTATVGKLFDSEITADALFSPNIEVEVRKNAVAILDSVTDIQTDADLIADILKTLESIVNVNLQAAKFTGIVDTLASQSVLSADSLRSRSTPASLDSQFALDIEFIVEYSADLEAESTAFARPTVFQEKDSAVTLELARYNNFGSFTNDAEFGNALVTNSVSSRADFREYSNIVFDGSNYVFVNRDRFVLKSPDLVNWTTQSPQLPVSGDKHLDFVNGYYLLTHESGEALYSTDAVNWNDDIDGLSSTFAGPVCQKIIYEPGDGRYYIIEFDTNQDDSFVDANLTGKWTTDDLDDPDANFQELNIFRIDGVNNNHSAGQGPIHSVVFNTGSFDQFLVAVATDEKIQIVDPGFFSFEAESEILDSSGIINFFVNNGNLYLASGTTLYKSTDNGQSWSVENSYNRIYGATGSSAGVFVYTYDGYPRVYLNNTEISDVNLGILAGRNFNDVFSAIETTDDDRVFITDGVGRILEFNGTGFDFIETPASAPVANIRGDLSTARQIEFFTKANTTGFIGLLWSSSQFAINRLATNDESIQGYEFEFGSEDIRVDITKPFDEYTHIKMLQDSSGTSVYIDGARVINTNYTDTLFAEDNFNIGRAFDLSAFIDELQVLNQADNPSSDTTTSVPQTDPGNTENTLGLFKFDNTFEVEQGFTLTADADLNSVFTLNADSIVLKDINSDIQSDFEVAAELGVIKQQTADLESEFTSSATATRAFALESAQNAQFSIAADANITQNVSADLSASFAQTAQNLRIKQGNIDTDAVATALTAAAKTGDFLVTLEAFTTLDAVTRKRTGIVVDFDADFNQTVEESRFRDYSSTQTSDFTLAASGDRIRFATEELETTVTLAVEELKILGLRAVLESSAEFTGTINGLFKTEAELDSQATTTISSTAFKEVPAELNAVASLNIATGVAFTLEETELSSAFTQTTEAREFVYLDELVYEIRGEDRSYIIPRENRAYTVIDEDRTWRIL